MQTKLSEGNGESNGALMMCSDVSPQDLDSVWDP